LESIIFEFLEDLVVDNGVLSLWAIVSKATDVEE
jgi:hypothetical protein